MGDLGGQVYGAIHKSSIPYMASDIISYFESRHLDNLVVITPDHPSGNYITKEDMLRLVSWTKDKGVRLV